jgi:hypothetical protein
MGLHAVSQSSLRHTCHLHHRDGDRYSGAWNPDFIAPIAAELDF